MQRGHTSLNILERGRTTNYVPPTSACAAFCRKNAATSARPMTSLSKLRAEMIANDVLNKALVTYGDRLRSIEVASRGQYH